VELKQLHYFKTVAELEHMTRAAERLNISQPALSRIISRLEESVGYPLFDRDQHRIVLNGAGRVFLRRAERALLEIEDGVKEIEVLNSTPNRTVTFSITESGFITGPLVSYLTSHRDLHVRQLIQSNEEMKQSLESGEIDFAVSFSPIKSDSIQWQPLISEEVLVFAALGNPLSKKEIISLKELKKQRFIFNNASYNIRNKICDYCRAIGFEPDIFYEGFENEVADKLLEANMGILFVPSTAYHFHFSEYPPPKTLASPIRIIEPVGRRVMGLSARKSMYLPEAAAGLYRFLLEYFSADVEMY